MREPDLADPLVRVASQWILALLLVVALTALFVAINAVQLTSSATGQRLLRRAVATLTDIDAALPHIHSDLLEAAAGAPGAMVRVPGFPIPVEMPVAEAATLSQAELRARLLEESARQAYAQGMAVLAAADPEAQDQRSIELISTAGVIDRGLGLITSGNQTRFRIAVVVAGGLSAALAGLLLAALRSYGRLLASGAIILAACLPALAAAVALRFGFRTAQDGADPFTYSLLELGVDAMWVPIRNYIALAALGAALLALGVVLGWAAARASLRSFPNDIGG